MNTLWREWFGFDRYLSRFEEREGHPIQSAAVSTPRDKMYSMIDTSKCTVSYHTSPFV